MVSLFHLPLLIALATAPAGRPDDLDFAPEGSIPDGELGQYYAELDLAIDGKEAGTLVVELWPEKAPATVRNFLRLCDEGFYQGLGIHRVMREYMIQGGDPKGDGTGDGPYGRLPDEVSKDPRYGHRYGVLSMAHAGPGTASCQFFICCADTEAVWSLDGKYSSFGRLASGIAALEAAANVPVQMTRRRELSVPTQKVEITATRVVQGDPPREEIVRPKPDLGGEPARLRLQALRVKFGGKANPSSEEAEAEVRALMARAQAGDDFSHLIREYSADKPREGEDPPGEVRIINHGVFDVESERRLYDARVRYRAALDDLARKFRAEEVDIAAFSETKDELQRELRELEQSLHWHPRNTVPNEFADLVFSLELGGYEVIQVYVGVVPRGWYVLKRIE